MRKITDEELKKLHNVEYEILDEFARICDKHKLNYVLIAGSCLGAIRHNGIIPWDDDIDVAMTRLDYEKFIKIQEKELNNKYYFESMEVDPDYNLVQGKIKKKNTIYKEEGTSLPDDKLGIWIDIFPLDNVSDNNFKMKLDFYKVFSLKMMISFKLGNDHHSKKRLREFTLKFLKFCSHFINVKKSQKKLYKALTKHKNDKTKRVISYGSQYFFKAVFDNSFTKDRVLHKFGPKEYYISKDYDKFLTQLYGDYMKLPPKEKQHPLHPIEKIKF